MGMYLHNLHLFGGTNFGLTSCKLFVHCRCECVTHYLWLSLELFFCIYFTLISVKLYIFDYFLHLCVHVSEVAGSADCTACNVQQATAAAATGSGSLASWRLTPHYPSLSVSICPTLFLPGVSGNSRSRPFPRMKAPDSLSRLMGMDFFIPFPFPNFGNGFFQFPSRSRILKSHSRSPLKKLRYF